MDHYTPPAWHAHALCSQAHDPRPWDIPDGDTHTPLAKKLVRAQQVCEGCTVVAACAREALEVPTVGVIRAGIPVPLELRKAPAARAALAAIADGMSPLAAALRLSNPYRPGTHYRAAHDALATMAGARRG